MMVKSVKWFITEYRIQGLGPGTTRNSIAIASIKNARKGKVGLQLSTSAWTASTVRSRTSAAMQPAVSLSQTEQSLHTWPAVSLSRTEPGPHKSSHNLATALQASSCPHKSLNQSTQRSGRIKATTNLSRSAPPQLRKIFVKTDTIRVKV